MLEARVAPLHTHIHPARGYAKAMAVDYLRSARVEAVANLFNLPIFDQDVFYLTMERGLLINYPNRAN